MSTKELLIDFANHFRYSAYIYNNLTINNIN